MAARGTGKPPRMLFYLATRNVGAVRKIRALCRIGDATQQPHMIILDLADFGSWWVHVATQ